MWLGTPLILTRIKGHYNHNAFTGWEFLSFYYIIWSKICFKQFEQFEIEKYIGPCGILTHD